MTLHDIEDEFYDAKAAARQARQQALSALESSPTPANKAAYAAADRAWMEIKAEERAACGELR